MKPVIHIVGVGSAGRESLGKKGLRVIESSGLIAGGKRHLSLFPELKARKVALQDGIEESAASIERYMDSCREAQKTPRVTVLATGDPNLYGIAGFMVKRFGKGLVDIIPNVSIPQEAFARIKEDWNSLKVLSVHGRDGIDRIAGEMRGLEKVAIFTDPLNTPARIAKALIRAGVSGYRACVCESLGAEDERIIRGGLGKIAGMKVFKPLNIMLLIRERAAPPNPSTLPAFGIPDSMFERRGSMITKSEIRAAALSKLSVKRDSVVWDIGSGSGSVAIEAARIAEGGKVYAVEKDRARARDIGVNKRRFGVVNLQIVRGRAPGCLGSIKTPPDAVFIGGGGAGIEGILSYVSKRMKRGSVAVVNAITLETAEKARGFFRKSGWDNELVLINISRAKGLGRKGEGLSMLSANNPVFIITGRKP